MVQDLLEQIKLAYEEKCRALQEIGASEERLSMKVDELNEENKKLYADLHAANEKWNSLMNQIDGEIKKNAIPTK